MQYELKLDMDFDAAHYLPEYKGKCANMHGHCWRVIVSMTTTYLNEQRMVMDFKEIKDLINQLDHQELNIFITQPTAENIAGYLFMEINRCLKKLEDPRPWLNYITVYESKGASITVRG